MPLLAKNHPLHLFLAGVIVSINVLALWYIFTFTTTYPLSIDEWIRFAPLNTRLLDGTLRLDQVMSAQSIVVDAPPTPIFLTWLMGVPNVLLFQWNLKVDALLNYLLILVNCILATLLLTAENRRLWIVVLVPVSALYLAIQQRYILLVAGQFYHMHIMLTLLSCVILTRRTIRWFDLALVFTFAFVATFFIISGAIIWIILFPLFLIRCHRNPVAVVLWIAAAALSVFLLSSLPNFITGEGFYALRGELSIGARATNYILFLLAYLGSVFTNGVAGNVTVAIALGGLGIIVFCINLWKVWRLHPQGHFLNQHHIILFVTLAAYGVLFGALASIGRADQYGVRGGLREHYIPFSVHFWLGLTGLIIAVFTRSRKIAGTSSRRIATVYTLNAILIVLCTVYFFLAVGGSIQNAQEHTTFVAQAEQCMEDVAAKRLPPDEGCEVVGGVALPEWIRSLAQHELTGFASDSR